MDQVIDGDLVHMKDNKDTSVPTPTQQSTTLVRPIILGDLTLASPTTQTTVGSAGGASALPATPTGYLTIMVGNTPFIVPYYAVS